MENNILNIILKSYVHTFHDVKVIATQTLETSIGLYGGSHFGGQVSALLPTFHRDQSLMLSQHRNKMTGVQWRDISEMRINNSMVPNFVMKEPQSHSYRHNRIKT